MMTEGQVIGARRNPASVIDRADAKAPDYFLDWSFEEVQRLARQGKFSEHSVIVRTTIDMGLQQAAEAAMESSLREYGESYRSEEHTSELKSLMRSSYAVFCVKKKK